MEDLPTQYAEMAETFLNGCGEGGPAVGSSKLNEMRGNFRKRGSGFVPRKCIVLTTYMQLDDSASHDVLAPIVRLPIDAPHAVSVPVRKIALGYERRWMHAKVEELQTICLG